MNKFFLFCFFGIFFFFWWYKINDDDDDDNIVIWAKEPKKMNGRKKMQFIESGRPVLLFHFSVLVVYAFVGKNNLHSFQQHINTLDMHTADDDDGDGDAKHWIYWIGVENFDPEYSLILYFGMAIVYFIYMQTMCVCVVIVSALYYCLIIHTIIHSSS
mgnify:CR=1 FL=1